MKKYIATATFHWNREMAEKLSRHRQHINNLIEEQVIEHYAASMEAQTVWMTLNAKNKREARRLLAPTPFYRHWQLAITELAVWDGQNYRLPALQLN